MTAEQLKAKMDENSWYSGEILAQWFIPQHLKLDWSKTLEFQNASYNKDNPGKFEKLLAAEQAFSTIKRLFGLSRGRYFGVLKTELRMMLAAIGMNLLKAQRKLEAIQG